MIRVCCHCEVVYGKKAPFEDKSLTHGACKPCHEKAMKEIDEMIEEENIVKKGGKMQTQLEDSLMRHKKNLAELYPKVSDKELAAVAEKIVKNSSSCYVLDRL